MDLHIVELDGADAWFAGGLTFELDPTLTVAVGRERLAGDARSTMRATRPRDAKRWPGHAGVVDDPAAEWTYTAAHSAK